MHWPNAVCMSVCLSVQGLSLIAPERLGRSGRNKHQKMRQSAGTTMALVTWCHVPRGTCHVPPRKPFEKVVDRAAAQTGRVRELKLSGNVHPGRGHVPCKLRLNRVKIMPSGHDFIFSLMPSSSDTLRARDTKFGTGVQCSKVYQR